MVLAVKKLIKVGSQVSCIYGPLITNPNASVKRQVLEVVVGTVLKATGIASWDVVFDFDGKVQNNVSSCALKISPDDS